jgi:hypothetical protein
MFIITTVKRNPNSMPTMKDYFCTNRCFTVKEVNTLENINLLKKQTSNNDLENPTWIIIKQNNKRILDVRYAIDRWIIIDWNVSGSAHFIFPYQKPNKFKAHLKEIIQRIINSYSKEIIPNNLRVT